MHSYVTIKNVSWPHFSWPNMYTGHRKTKCHAWCTTRRSLKQTECLQQTPN